MFDPIATYRIQFHKDFTFANLEAIIPYLKELGIRTLYASPIFKAAPGSNHGYDVTDPLQVNPEIGTLEQLRNVASKLKQEGISWLQDIVPNHMAFHHDNAWLMDLLKNGPESPYRSYFDQSLADGTFFKDKIMVPFLGDDLEKVISEGQLQIKGEAGSYHLQYADQQWPLRDDVEISDLESINKDPKALLAIASQQHYRLCSWRETDKRINYRRFFTVNSLVCLNMHDKAVFDHYHSFTATLLQEGTIQGLRVDHVDGLYDPTAYLQRLRELAGDETYIVVEKILEAGENLADWPIQGTTGYEFLAHVNNLFTDSSAAKGFTKYYDKLTGLQGSIEEQILDKKALILEEHMQGELENLTSLFVSSGLGQENNRDVIKEGIFHLLVKFPVYRFYGDEWPLPEKEKDALKGLLADNPSVELKALPDATSPAALAFYQRCMQLSGPLMAKGVEDTLMYTNNRFIGHNEVGDSPLAFGITADDFHSLMQERQAKWSLALSASATHDTKRGEDARARLNALSHLSEEWFDHVDKWQKLNTGLKENHAPDANDEYFIYQSLIASCPPPGMPMEGYAERLTAYLQKALREAKVHSGWADPNEEYESATLNFATSLLNDNSKFWESFQQFLEKVSTAGNQLSLAQTAVKLLSPGVPDVYQGSELDDLSFVDPDNRRPVDYEARKKLLQAGDGRVALIKELLMLRTQSADVFSKGSYIPLKLSGPHADEVLAFARVWEQEWIVTIIPITLRKDWANTALALPEDAPQTGENVLTRRCLLLDPRLKIAPLFKDKGIAVLRLKASTNPRIAGVLLHITSLPSPYGCGDMGPRAHEFAGKLKSTGQRCWQILPLNAVSQADAFSPYSPLSSRAGNILLISPEALVEDQLLAPADLTGTDFEQSSTAQFDQVQQHREAILAKAWANVTAKSDHPILSEFKAFCEQEQEWLDDYALFVTLKQTHDGQPWNAWPDDVQFRRPSALQSYTAQHAAELELIRWQQFIFSRQWLKLKSHCNALGIKILGDLPFYISYDSVDVWANPELFDLDYELRPVNVSGVPPDYFNADGQRWGTPVYNWDALKKDGYKWWVNRIGKNLQWFDLLRLDHFRAFSAYWSVPQSEPTARNGEWVPGPGEDLFEALKSEFTDMPLVAEDLGDIDDAVYELKNKYGLPGMKVLQFAFGDDISDSPHIGFDHHTNDYVYTGTHDNNTSRGWYQQDAGKKARKNLRKFTGTSVNEKKAAHTLIREAYRSVANVVIIPLQDWLNLDETARMNTPAGEGNNWTWRLTTEQLEDLPLKKMRKWTRLFGRA